MQNLTIIGITIQGSSIGTEEQMVELLQYASQGIITPFIEVFEFSKVPELIHGLVHDEIKGRAVVTLPQNL